MGHSVKINSTSQSLILPGESLEADQRFERALRLNGAHESAHFRTADRRTDIQGASRTGVRSNSRRWAELYRLVAAV